MPIDRAACVDYRVWAYLIANAFRWRVSLRVATSPITAHVADV